MKPKALLDLFKGRDSSSSTIRNNPKSTPITLHICIIQQIKIIFTTGSDDFSIPKKVVIALYVFKLKILCHGHRMINQIQLNHKTGLKQIYSGLTSNRLFASDHV